MARPRPPEDLDDLLEGPLEGRTLTEWCVKHRLHPRTVHRIRAGEVRANRGTILGLALALGLGEDRVTKACAETWRASTVAPD